MIWGKPQNLKRSLVISLFDGTKFDVVAQLTYGAFLALFILLLSLSLGIAGFFQKERKRIFSILGFNFSFLILFGVFLFSLYLF
jgi:hypothetical protein